MKFPSLTLPGVLYDGLDVTILTPLLGEDEPVLTLHWAWPLIIQWKKLHPGLAEIFAPDGVTGSDIIN